MTKHVNSVNERILWGMVATSLGMSDESIAGVLYLWSREQLARAAER